MRTNSRHLVVHHLLLHQLCSQNAARQHAKQMEELRDGDEYVTRTHQVELRYQRMIVGFVFKLIAWNNIAVPGRQCPRLLVVIVKILVGMLQCVLVHIAKVNVELVIVLLLHLRMGHLDPVRFVLDGDVGRRLAVEFAVTRRWCCVDDARHKPGGWNFAQEDDEDGAQLPSAPLAGDIWNNISVWCCHCGVCCCAIGQRLCLYRFVSSTFVESVNRKKDYSRNS